MEKERREQYIITLLNACGGEARKFRFDVSLVLHGRRSAEA